MKTHKAGLIVVFILLFAILGYFREFFFVNLNLILFQQYYHRPSPIPIPAIMRVFERLDYDTLYYLKYPFTFMGACVFFAANYFVVLKFTGNRFLGRIVVYVYAAMLIVAGLSMCYGYFFNHRLQSDEYTLSRWLLGIAQSPIICLILLASEKLYNSQPHDQKR